MITKKECVAMLLAGGQGSRLYALTKDVAKPAVSYGSKYKIIDFPLSNCTNSNIDTVGVLTQYKPLILNEYLGNGQSWDLDRTYGGVHILPPYQGKTSSDWYKGTANAIYQNINFIKRYSPDYVLVLSGDHIYKMNYNKMLEFHKQKNADITIAVLEVPMEEASRFGIMSADKDMRIYDFAEKVDIEKIEYLIEEQISCNMKIAKAGLENNFGANIGQTLLKTYPNDVSIKAKAYAAAASDARMNGCELPVVINNGSGNQGITCSVPVIIYAEELKVSHEKLIRALILSNLLNTHIKSGIGRLSAFCGAVAAGCAAGAAIAYLHGGDLKMVSHTIVNSLAIVSGIICDGAKASCAGKIASSIDAGILGFKLYEEGNQFYSGEGIVTKGGDNTIKNVGILASRGMAETDKEIINLMLKNDSL